MVRVRSEDPVDEGGDRPGRCVGHPGGDVPLLLRLGDPLDQCLGDRQLVLQQPGFLAGRVDFESTLQAEIVNGQVPAGGQRTVTRSMDPTRTDGNNVNLDTETVIATETGLRYQLSISALDGKYALLRSALRTQ